MHQPPSLQIADPIRLSDIRKTGELRFEAQIKVAELDALRELLELVKLSKVTFSGVFEAEPNGDVILTGKIGATVVQPCSVTLEPVTTRIDSKVARRFVVVTTTEDAGGETELKEDDPEDLLPESFSLFDLLAEGLALEIPLYPRIDDAEMIVSAVTEPGKSPMTDEEAKPFAGLAELKDQLEKKGDGS